MRLSSHGRGNVSPGLTNPCALITPRRHYPQPATIPSALATALAAAKVLHVLMPRLVLDDSA